MAKYFFIFLSFIEFIFLILGVSLPLARIDEFWIFTSEFSVLSISKNLIINNEFLLGIIIIVFGLIFPIIKIILRHTNLEIIQNLNLHKFSMIDIFLISFLVFSGKISNFFEIEILLGFYCLFISMLLGYIQILINKRYTQKYY